MIGDLFLYNILKISLLLILFIYGFCISKSHNKRNILITGVITIIAFSLIEGLRWDRGPDYYNNYLLLTSNAPEVTKSEPLFNAIISTFKMLSLPYWLCFVLFSFLYIYSFTKVVKEFPKAAIWALPVMFLTTIAPHENLIRQFLAISFILFAYYFYIKQKKVPMLLCLLCVFNIHFSGIFAIAMFGLVIFFKLEKYIRTPMILVGAYILLYFLWDTSYLSPLTNTLSNLDIGNEDMQHYLENADRWFTDEGSLSELHGTSDKTSLVKIFFDLITNCAIIYFGFLAIKQDKRLRIPYWFTFFALIIFVLGGDIEIYSRFAWWLYIFMPIMLGSIWYSAPMKPKIRTALISIIAFSYAYAFIRGFSDIPYSGYAFVWDL